MVWHHARSVVVCHANYVEFSGLLAIVSEAQY